MTYDTHKNEEKVFDDSSRVCFSLLTLISPQNSKTSKNVIVSQDSTKATKNTYLNIKKIFKKRQKNTFVTQLLLYVNDKFPVMPTNMADEQPQQTHMTFSHLRILNLTPWILLIGEVIRKSIHFCKQLDYF